jgi:hypothetical protein
MQRLAGVFLAARRPGVVDVIPGFWFQCLGCREFRSEFLGLGGSGLINWSELQKFKFGSRWISSRLQHGEKQAISHMSSLVSRKQ